MSRPHVRQMLRGTAVAAALATALVAAGPARAAVAHGAHAGPRSSVPEPAPLGLVALGGALLAATVARRRATVQDTVARDIARARTRP